MKKLTISIALAAIAVAARAEWQTPIPLVTSNQLADATNATLIAANRYTDEHGGGVSPETVSNVVDNLIASYDTTSLTPRIDGKMSVTGGVSRIGGIRFGAFDDADPGVYSHFTPDGLKVSSVVEEGAAEMVIVADSGITIKSTDSSGVKLTKDWLRLGTNDNDVVNWPTKGGTFARVEDIGDYTDASIAPVASAVTNLQQTINGVVDSLTTALEGN